MKSEFHKNRATGAIIHYFKMIFEKSGLEVDFADFASEMDCFVEDIIDATKERIEEEKEMFNND